VLAPAALGWVVSPVLAAVLAAPGLAILATDRGGFRLWVWHVWAWIAMALIRQFADETGIPWRSEYVVTLDRIVGMGRLPTSLLQQHLSMPYLDVFACWIYASFLVVPFVAAGILWIAGGDVRRFVAAASLAYVTCLTVFFLVPTVPPWLASAGGSIEPIRRIFVETMMPAAPGALQAGYAASANDVAAMPSMHLALTFLAALALARFGRIIAFAAAGYAACMSIAIVYLGEHYAVDAIAGALVAFGCWWLAGRLPGFLDRRLPRGPRPAAERRMTGPRR
jgi:membrane-associated phospholipid phosphatase